MAQGDSRGATLRQRQKAATGRAIRQAAYALFEEKGYHQATMRELAARAGVALGTIFQHFPDKPSLLFAAFSVDMEEVVVGAFDSLPTDAPLREQLLHLVRPIYEFYGARPALSRILVKECLFPEGEWAGRLEGLVMAFLGRVGGLFQAAIEGGDLAEDFDLADGLAAFWSLYFVCLIGALREPSFDVEGWLDRLGGLLDQHILKASPQPRRSP